MKVQPGQEWIYLQSLRPYVVINVKDDDVTYKTNVISPAMGKIFKVSLTDFLEKFVKPEDLTEDMKQESLRNQLRMQGLWNRGAVTEMAKYCSVDVSKNNCHACVHLEYVEAESWDPSGYCCNGREYKSTNEEKTHLKRLEKQTYRARTKKCCERKEVK